MAIPVFIFMAALISNFPANLVEASQVFLAELLFPSPPVLIGKLVIVLGLIIIIYSIIYLAIKKDTGFVISGPYRFIRHPQYTGFLLFTIGLTGWSYFFITHTYGISWISPEATIALWYVELIAYVILALVEELYLSKKFGIEYDIYRSQIPLFIPFLKTGKLDIIISVFVFSILLLVVILFC